MRGVAINVGANTGAPGFRGPIWPDGRFEFLPIPESEPTADPVPTYGDLRDHLEQAIPRAHWDTPVHLDPEFPEYPFGERYSYGDEHGVKAGPLSSLSEGDYVFFYATLTPVAEPGAVPDWQAPEWGAYLVGQFRLARDPVTAADYAGLSPARRQAFANNAHVKRERFDARVLVAGARDGSRLYDRAVPLSAAATGTTPSDLVTEHSTDSGAGPWWRRPLRFDAEGVAELLARTD